MPDVQQRLFEQYPNVKLMALVRDPVDKAISHIHHDRKLGVEHRTVEEAITQELDILENIDSLWPPPKDYWETERGYVWHGLYANPIADWVSRFPKENMLVIPARTSTPGPPRRYPRSMPISACLIIGSPSTRFTSRATTTRSSLPRFASA